MFLAAGWASFADKCRRARGWRRAGMGFCAGAAMSLAMPPYNLFPLLALGLPVAVWLLQGADKKCQAFAVGWTFSFGFLTFSLYWIAAAMFVDIAHFWWAVPLAVAGLPALFAIYYGLAAIGAHSLGKNGSAGVLTFGLCWFAADVARGTMFTGFPWNFPGYAWSDFLPMLQITSVAGIYGLNLLTVLVACLPASLADKTPAARRVTASGFALLAVIAAWGYQRLETTPIANMPDVRLRLVQPNIDQSRKWRIDERQEGFDKLLDLTTRPTARMPTHIVWPETASTYYLSEDAAHRQEIASRIPAAATVLTGVIRRNWDADGQMRFYNSLVAVDGLGRLVAGYDKFHLVPFGEYMPWRRYIPLRTLAASGADFTPGEGPRSLRVLGLPVFSPLICYEAIFPGAVIAANDRPDFLLNVTNDGWYGDTIGPYQHFAIARVRAIEEGLPLARAANTGISGMIDPMGRVTASLAVGREGLLDVDLPRPLPPTLYSKEGNAPVWGAFILLSIFIIVNKYPKKGN